MQNGKDFLVKKEDDAMMMMGVAETVEISQAEEEQTVKPE